MNDGSRVLILRYLIAKSFRLVGLKPVVPEIYLPYQMALARERHGGRKKIVLYADHVEITETIPDGMPEREVTLTYLDSFELVRVLIGDSVGRNASWTAYAWMAKPPLHAWKLALCHPGSTQLMVKAGSLAVTAPRFNAPVPLFAT